jgi:phosphoribosylformylglycinamidine cyclo-ligase
MSDCALIGGETAEMPGFYPENEYDIAGFAVGIVERGKMITPDNQKSGDVLIALPSSGVHSNGFSLVRKIFALNEQNVARHYSEIGTNLGEELLTPTKIYVKPILSLIEKFAVKGIANITGGGFYENIPRMIRDGLCAEIETSEVTKRLPSIFSLLQKTGNIPDNDMYSTFKMGEGMVLAVAEDDADAIISYLKELGENAFILGRLIEADEKIVLK